MNSEETLSRIKRSHRIAMACLGIDKPDIETEEAIKIIEKDLEILEIIKKWSFIQENYKDGYGKFTQFLCNIHTIGMKEDFEKVKEWLDNDK